MSYVYIKTEKGVWTVGFYKILDEWVAESDHSIKEEAAARVHYLNGGSGHHSHIALRLVAALERIAGRL